MNRAEVIVGFFCMIIGLCMMIFGFPAGEFGIGIGILGIIPIVGGVKVIGIGLRDES